MILLSDIALVMAQATKGLATLFAFILDKEVKENRSAFHCDVYPEIEEKNILRSFFIRFNLRLARLAKIN